MEHPTSRDSATTAPGRPNANETTALPSEVVQCLENARFLHLGTCTNNQPHVSLMNYTYLPSSPYTSFPAVVMTTKPASKKCENLVANPNVSLLVHDWVSHRPPTTTSRRLSGVSNSDGPEYPRSSLASLLVSLNTSSISSISATINGKARLVERGTEEEKYYREKHLENNTFEEGGSSMGRLREGGRWERERENEAGRCFVEDEEMSVIVVRIEDVRVSDWKGEIREWNSVDGRRVAVNGFR